MRYQAAVGRRKLEMERSVVVGAAAEGGKSQERVRKLCRASRDMGQEQKLEREVGAVPQPPLKIAVLCI